MPIPLMHDRPAVRRASPAQRSADGQAEIGYASAHLDKALEHHAKHMHSHVKNCIEDAQRCLQRVMNGPGSLPSATTNPTGHEGAQTSNGQNSRAERMAESDRLAEVGRGQLR